MRNGLTVLADLPWPIAAGWFVFLAWGALQLVWYRRARIAPAAVVQPSEPPRAAPARRARRPKSADTPVGALPPIELDSIAETNVVAPTQTVLGL